MAIITTVVHPTRDMRKSELRMGRLEQLNEVVAIRDTARGLMATLPDSAFSGSELHSAVSGRLARLATLVKAYPGLRIDIEGNMDSRATEACRRNAPRRYAAFCSRKGFPPAASPPVDWETRTPSDRTQAQPDARPTGAWKL